MINKIYAIVPVALTMAFTQTGQAVPITGNIGFSGDVQLNTTDARTATAVLNWINTVVGSDSGNFSGIAPNTAVLMTSPWSFNSGALNNFWQVGGYTFNLISSTVSSRIGQFLDVNLSGTVTGNGFDATTFSGTFQVANPSADGQSKFTERLSFASPGGGAPTPDGGMTAILLGLACASLAVVKYKFA
jgi:hypothetical protein